MKMKKYLLFACMIVPLCSGCVTWGKWRSFETEEQKMFRHRGFSAQIPNGMASAQNDTAFSSDQRWVIAQSD